MDFTILSLNDFSEHIRRPDFHNWKDVVSALEKSDPHRREAVSMLIGLAKRVRDLEYSLALEKRASEIVASAVQVALAKK